MTVSLVIVSHSQKLAEGVVELAGQMAPEVRILAAGGMDADAAGQSALGTSLTKISSALATADVGDGVLVLADLGSAVMTAETALELLGNPESIRLAEAPVVEGAVAAAVAAQSGAALAAVQSAAESASGVVSAFGTSPLGGTSDDSTLTEGQQQTNAAANSGVISTAVELINPMGLHARPAATLAAALGAMNVEIEINGVDGQSVMMLMTLGAGQGTTLQVTASGPDAQRAVDLVRSEVTSGFGEI
ncbi:dihydroxyacetone kinase phosphoryl donor subunit DhaM [Psychromicrobium lacuslunae]|uniref:Phosphocarrier protein HPr n=1 Tax=Psychromicrobium lacuslunae TaxID=1618207 RepID=A0A0D4C103_9MICC|nr:dihydroxyacetone kinase phosphoryl donor subunit DhaM [Psychromicrobium lacuslunae]AJT42372.1 dihydroxyacetone kinase [Psychromicrobium lacuslunae]